MKKMVLNKLKMHQFRWSHRLGSNHRCLQISCLFFLGLVNKGRIKTYIDQAGYSMMASLWFEPLMSHKLTHLNAKIFFLHFTNSLAYVTSSSQFKPPASVKMQPSLQGSWVGCNQAVDGADDITTQHFQSQVNCLSVRGPQVDSLISQRGLECPTLFFKLWM